MIFGFLVDDWEKPGKSVVAGIFELRTGCMAIRRVRIQRHRQRPSENQLRNQAGRNWRKLQSGPEMPAGDKCVGGLWRAAEVR
jgi:hypothetical protein